MMDTKTVALARLRETRESAGLTQEMLADYAGVSCRTVQRIEAGFSASIETAKALAAALELKDINALIKQNADSRQESVSPEASGGSGMSGLGVLYGFCFCVFLLLVMDVVNTVNPQFFNSRSENADDTRFVISQLTQVEELLSRYSNKKEKLTYNAFIQSNNVKDYEKENLKLARYYINRHNFIGCGYNTEGVKLKGKDTLSTVKEKLDRVRSACESLITESNE